MAASKIAAQFMISCVRELALVIETSVGANVQQQQSSLVRPSEVRMVGLLALQMHGSRKAQRACDLLAFLAPGVVSRALPSSASPVSISRNRSGGGDSCVLFPRRNASLRRLHNRRAPYAQTPASSSIHAQVPVILIVDHGSKRKEANEMLSEVGELLQRKTELPVHTAHMELASPSIADGIDKCVKEGAMHIIVVPFFLSPGRHSTKDIPQMTANAAAKHPGVTYDVRPPIGTHPGIIDVILDRAGLLGSVQK